MAENALVTTRVNEAIKQEAAQVLATMGLTVSDAVRLMLTKIAREHRFPFELRESNEASIAAQKAACTEQGEPVTIDQLQDSLTERVS